MPETKMVSVRSMVANRTLEPAVTLRLGEEFANLPVSQAREIAHNLLECAESAEQDAFLVGWLQRHGFDRQSAGNVLHALRNSREGGDDV